MNHVLGADVGAHRSHRRRAARDAEGVRRHPQPAGAGRRAGERQARAGRQLRAEHGEPGDGAVERDQIKEYGFPADYWDTYPEKIAAVTAADVQRVAQKYVPLDDLVIVAVGDAAKIRSVLAEFGPIEEWDAEGRRRTSK